MEFTVDRQLWDRASYENASKGELLTPEGKMCCLGFVCLQLGFCNDDILEVNFPHEAIFKPNLHPELLKSQKEEFFDFALKHSGNHLKISSLSSNAAAINDDPDTPDSYKEESLKMLFAEYNHTINFIN